MMKLQTLAALAVGILTATLGGFEIHAQPATPVGARNVVLIHGAWADGSKDFKLATGTWVHVGGLRVGVLAAASPALQDAIVAGRRSAGGGGDRTGVTPQAEGPDLAVYSTYRNASNPVIGATPSLPGKISAASTRSSTRR
jgi:hypothetical protein